MITDKIKSLETFLGRKIDGFDEDDNTGFVDHESYLVLTDEETDEEIKKYILDSLWTFNSWFLVEQIDLPEEAIEMIEVFKNTKCEDANSTIRAMINDEDDFVNAAISADGRGHFLSFYDGEENEVCGDECKYFIYRVD